MQNLVQILSTCSQDIERTRNILISIKDHTYVINFRKLTLNNANLYLVNINAYAKFAQIPSISFLKILSGNEILTSIKGHNSVINFRKLTLKNLILDHINISAYAKFGQIH